MILNNDLPQVFLVVMKLNSLKKNNSEHDFCQLKETFNRMQKKFDELEKKGNAEKIVVKVKIKGKGIKNKTIEPCNDNQKEFLRILMNKNHSNDLFKQI